MKKAGKDATLSFKMSHPEHVLKDMVAQWAVGYLEGAELHGDLKIGTKNGGEKEGSAAVVVNNDGSTTEGGCFAKIVQMICGGGK